MSHQFITYSTAQGVARITLNRPEVLNSFHSAMSKEMQAALVEVARDSEVRALLLMGAGRAFCAGQDLAEVAPGPEATPSPPTDFSEHVRQVYNPLVRGLRNLEKPVVCAVGGVAAGAGANLALACDFVFASRQASFIQAFSKIGLVPDTGGSFFLPRLVGLARATALILTGEKLSAEQALAYGLIYRVCEPTALEEEASVFATHLASQATRALGLSKRLLNASLSNGLEAQLELEAELQGAAGQSADYREGLAAFVNKRSPKFKGN